jgi:hypothetical protein
MNYQKMNGELSTISGLPASLKIGRTKPNKFKQGVLLLVIGGYAQGTAVNEDRHYSELCR